MTTAASSRVNATAPCPCAPDRAYATCCGRYHGGEPAPTAEALMRSRYSAYVLGLSEYLSSTWHSGTQPLDLRLQNEAPRQWLGLDIRRSLAGTDNNATVEFVARFKIDGRAFRLHETSRFIREQGRWYYVDGDIHD